VIKKLLIVMAAAAVLSFVCFFILTMTGFPKSWEVAGPPGWGNDPPWARGTGYGGPRTTRNLAYNGGYRLIVSYPAEISVTQGAQPRFTVTGPQGLLDSLTLDNGVLYGPRGPRWIWGGDNAGSNRLHIDIVTPNTHEFHLSGAQDLTLHGYDQDTLEIYVSGAGDIEGQGKARRLEAHISGAGDLKLDQLTVDDAVVSISGAGDARLDARRSSDVWLTGAGDVQFKCRPASTNERKTGFGDISYGPSCTDLQPPAPPAPEAPATPAPANPEPKSKI
jgi:hypothetical protein